MTTLLDGSYIKVPSDKSQSFQDSDGRLDKTYKVEHNENTNNK